MEVMLKQNQEPVRRVLQAALNKLDAETRGSVEGSNSISFSEIDSTPPVILVLVSGLEPQPGGPSDALNAVAGQPATMRSDQVYAAHPGLERFPLAVTDSRSTAPKPCFMEPGRACVNSGACEMRGF